jgi:hypothetical protein
MTWHFDDILSISPDLRHWTVHGSTEAQLFFEAENAPL